MMSLSCEHAGDASDVGDEQPCFGAGDGFLPILGHATTASEPSEEPAPDLIRGALDHPPSGDDLKANRGVGALDDLNGPAADLLDRPAQLGSAIAAIGEEFDPERDPSE